MMTELTNAQVSDMTAKICSGRTCSKCPIDGFCLIYHWGGNDALKQKIIEEYKKLFGDGNEIEISDMEILSLFGGE